jgi:hypothetical protein
MHTAQYRISGFAITSFTEHLLFNDTGPGVVSIAIATLLSPLM